MACPKGKPSFFLEASLVSASLVSTASSLLLKSKRIEKESLSFVKTLSFVPASFFLDIALLFFIILFSFSRRFRSSSPVDTISRTCFFLLCIVNVLLTSAEFSFESFTGEFIDWNSVFDVVFMVGGTKELAEYGIDAFIFSLILHFLAFLVLTFVLIVVLRKNQSSNTGSSSSITSFILPFIFTTKKNSKPTKQTSTKTKTITLIAAACVMISFLSISSEPKIKVHRFVGTEVTYVASRLFFWSVFGQETTIVEFNDLPDFDLDIVDHNPQSKLLDQNVSVHQVQQERVIDPAQDLITSTLPPKKKSIFVFPDIVTDQPVTPPVITKIEPENETLIAKRMMNETDWTLFQPKHVIVLLAESLREGVFPFDYESGSLKDVIFPDQKYKRQITPFVTSLVETQSHNVALIDRVLSPSSFTIKTFLSLMCEVWPLNRAYTIEKSLYQECIPRLLKKQRKGWDSSFVSPVYLSFDNFQATINRVGFDSIISAEKMWNLKLPDVNSFGKDDSTILPFIEEYLTRVQHKPETRVFMNILSSTMHGPFNIPSDAEKIDFMPEARSGSLPKYLRALHRFDKFFEKLIDLFVSKDLMKDTLFVVIGDHGHPFVEDTDCQKETNLGCIEEKSFRVPLLFYSQHPHFPSKLLEASTKNRTWSHIDVAATIKEILSISTPPSFSSIANLEENVKPSLNHPIHSFFGRSLIHPELLAEDNIRFTRTTRSSTDRLLPMFSSPGGTSFLVYDPFTAITVGFNRMGFVNKLIDTIPPAILDTFDQSVAWARRAAHSSDWKTWITLQSIRFHQDLCTLFKVAPDIILKSNKP